ncbi:MAG: amidohydrolase family protein [Amnibacterium sp.]
MIIDAHLHVWDRTRADYAWLGPHLAPIDRTVAFDEVVPALDRHGVDGVVLVQAADEAGDTAALLELAAREPRVLGVVAWVPLERPAEAAPMLDDLLATGRVVGIRNLIHDRSDPDWALREAFDRGLGLLEERGVPFDFVTRDAAALPRLLEVARRHPGLPLVLDHLGKPSFRRSSALRRAWDGWIREAGAVPTIAAKVSGLYADGTDPAAWRDDDVRAVTAAALDAFGSARLLYGGDWPVSLTAGGYDRVLHAMRTALADLPAEQREDVLWRTAARVYRLPPVNR